MGTDRRQADLVRVLSAREPVRLVTRDHREAVAEAEVSRLGLGGRVVRALAFLGGGVVGGLLSLPIPVAHLVLPWLLPILGLVGAALAFQGRGRVPAVHGTCLDCGEAFVVDGGPIEDPLWIRCPACTIPLRVVLADAD